MDKFDSLRNSIRQILEQEEQLGRMSPENSEKSRLNPETQLDQKTLEKILLQKSYKLNNVVFDNMLHFLFTAKALGDSEGRFKYISEYIDILFKKISRVFSNSSSVVNRQDDYEEQKRLSASYIIKNLNSLLESEKSSSTRVRSYEPTELLRDLTKIDNITTGALSNAGLPDNLVKITDTEIERVITQIDTGFGHFVELALFEVLNAISIIINKKFNIQTESGLDMTSFKARYLDLIKTREEHFHKAIDYFYIYYLFAYDKTIRLDQIEYHYDAYNKNIDNARQKALSKIASEFFRSAGESIIFEITKSLQVLRNKVCIEQNNDNLVWIPGIKDTNKKGSIEYDLWLIDSKDSDAEPYKKPDCYAKIDIKAYRKGAEIELSSVDHNVIEDLHHNRNCRYYGLINLEKQSSFFINKEYFTNVTLSLKMFLFDKISMKNQKGKFVKNLKLNRKSNKKTSKTNLTKTLQFDPNSHEYILKNSDDLKDFLELDNNQREQAIIKSQKGQSIDPEKVSSDIDDEQTNSDIDDEQASTHWPPSGEESTYIVIKTINKNIAARMRKQLRLELRAFIEDKIDDDWKFKTEPVNRKTICEYIKEYFEDDDDNKIVFSNADANSKKIENITKRFIEQEYSYFHFSFKVLDSGVSRSTSGITYQHDDEGGTSRRSNYVTRLKKNKSYNEDEYLFKKTILSDYFSEVERAIAWSEEKERREPPVETLSHNIKGNIISEDILRSIVRNILEEGDKKKSYSGSHPEESYGWSAKEEDFMFDLPGLTTWEEDRQWVKEYLKSMGMLKNKK